MTETDAPFGGVAPDDFLFCDTVPQLVKATGHPGLVCWDAGFDVDRLFAEKDRPDAVVFTANYDGGPHEQSRHFANQDLPKYVYAVDWDAVVSERQGYVSLPLGPAAREGRCVPWHYYAVKTDRYTHCTFPCVPRWCLRWFTVNANIDDPAVSLLPFGLHYDDPQKPVGPVIEKVREEVKGKEGLVYVNFSLYSARRLAIREAWRKAPHGTFREKADLPRSDYLAELAAHKFALCPAGCGLDQFRIYEALYVGTIPVVEDSPWARRLKAEGLPVLVVQDMTRLPAAALEQVWEAAIRQDWNLRFTTRSHWKKTLERLADELDSV